MGEAGLQLQRLAIGRFGLRLALQRRQQRAQVEQCHLSHRCLRAGVQPLAIQRRSGGRLAGLLQRLRLAHQVGERERGHATGVGGIGWFGRGESRHGVAMLGKEHGQAMLWGVPRTRSAHEQGEGGAIRTRAPQRSPKHSGGHQAAAFERSPRASAARRGQNPRLASRSSTSP